MNLICSIRVIESITNYLLAEFCFPVRVESSPDVGNYLVASRDIAPLELIILDPVATPQGPLHDEDVDCPLCLGCYEPLTEGSLQLCAKCRLPLCHRCCNSPPQHHTDYECRFFAENGAIRVNPNNFGQQFNAVSVRLELHMMSSII